MSNGAVDFEELTAKDRARIWRQRLREEREAEFGLEKWRQEAFETLTGISIK
jgi:hypothetical protein